MITIAITGIKSSGKKQVIEGSESEKPKDKKASQSPKEESKSNIVSYIDYLTQDAYQETEKYADYYSQGNPLIRQYGSKNIFAEKLPGVFKPNMDQESLKTTLVEVGRVLADSGKESLIAKDITFSVPKSVSVTFAGADDATRKAIINAFDNAVGKTISYIEKNMFVTRYTENGLTQTVKAEGLSATGFLHLASRAADPQLHMHVLLWNSAIRSLDGQERAVDFDQLLKRENLHTIDTVMLTNLARELEKEGFLLKYDEKGKSFEIAGFERKDIEAFSKRERAILEYAKNHGLDLRCSEDRKEATFSTRENKKNVELKQRFKEWNKEIDDRGLRGVIQYQQERRELLTLAQKEGWNQEKLQKELNDLAKQYALDITARSLPRDEIVLRDAASEAGRLVMTLRDGVFTKNQFVKEALEFANVIRQQEIEKYGRPVSDQTDIVERIEKAFDKYVEEGRIVSAGFDKHNTELFSTREFVRAEQKVIDSVKWEKDAWLTKEAFDNLIKETGLETA